MQRCKGLRVLLLEALTGGIPDHCLGPAYSVAFSPGLRARRSSFRISIQCCWRRFYDHSAAISQFGLNNHCFIMRFGVILVVFLQLCESTIEGFKPLDWGERLSQGHLFMYHHGCTSNEVQFHDVCRSCTRLQGTAFREIQGKNRPHLAGSSQTHYLPPSALFALPPCSVQLPWPTGMTQEPCCN